jgi:hypothetical protein
MEREEKHKQLFLSFHSPLGISQKARDSHIPTARHRPGWKSGKPKTGFPLSHAGLATTATVCPDLEPKTKKGDRPLRGLLLIFQDHLVLETETDFRSILRLENADAQPFSGRPGNIEAIFVRCSVGATPPAASTRNSETQCPVPPQL